MFIEYEIKEGIRLYKSVIKLDYILSVYCTDDSFKINYIDGVSSFSVQPKTLYDAFTRALAGESVIMEGIGYIRPIKAPEKAKEPSIHPVKTITWRDVP